MSNLYSEGGTDKQLPDWPPCLCASSFPCEHSIISRSTQQKPAAQVFPLWPQRWWPGNCPYMARWMTHMLSFIHILLKLPPSAECVATVAAGSIPPVSQSGVEIYFSCSVDSQHYVIFQPPFKNISRCCRLSPHISEKSLEAAVDKCAPP